MGTSLVKFGRDTARDVKQVARGWRWGRRPQVPRSAEPYVIPKETSVFPTKWARTPAAIAVRDLIQKGPLSAVLRFEVNPRVSGLDSLLKVNGPALIVANHSSHLDTPLILCTLPDAMRRKTAFAAAADYFFDTWWRATTSAIVFNTFPIERRGGNLSSTPGDLLEQGWNVVVFPEGTRSPDGWIQRFRMGAAYLAVEHGVPVIPVGIKGSFAAMPRGRGWPVPGRPTVAVRYGDPLTPAEGESPREFAPKIAAAVSALLDEESTTWWDARRRAAAGASPSQSGPDAAHWRRVWESTAPIKAAGSKRRAWK
ncbi:lysophospholipid acyltransferase family protein [Kribbella sp. CA-247076]|uniref:lysophospholipid acyltransferase family protein n=1 Tax=Kribbella sp. CA-247076 TaxID=3239941 RepID=UPI003D8CD586